LLGEFSVDAQLIALDESAGKGIAATRQTGACAFGCRVVILIFIATGCLERIIQAI
jgi:hypothetical protein